MRPTMTALHCTECNCRFATLVRAGEQRKPCPCCGAPVPVTEGVPGTTPEVFERAHPPPDTPKPEKSVGAKIERAMRSGGKSKGEGAYSKK